MYRLLLIPEKNVLPVKLKKKPHMDFDSSGWKEYKTGVLYNPAGFVKTRKLVVYELWCARYRLSFSKNDNIVLGICT